MRAGIPTCPELDLPDEVEAAARLIVERAERRGVKPGFVWARSILKPPGWYAALSDRLRLLAPEVEVVDPYTFFGLIRRMLAEELAVGTP